MKVFLSLHMALSDWDDGAGRSRQYLVGKAGMKMSANLRRRMDSEDAQAGTLTFRTLSGLVQFQAAFQMQCGRAPLGVIVLDCSFDA